MVIEMKKKRIWVFSGMSVYGVVPRTQNGLKNVVRYVDLSVCNAGEKKLDRFPLTLQKTSDLAGHTRWVHTRAQSSLGQVADTSATVLL